MKRFNFYGCLLILLGTGLVARAQQYHAIYGSNYAGSLGMQNNPASMVNTPFSWDVQVAGFQWFNSTNAIQINDFSLLSPSPNSTYRFVEGGFPRYADLSNQAHLLHTRIAINRKHVIGFGFSMKSYTNARASSFQVVDTINSAQDFLTVNQANGGFDLKGRGAGWAEMFVSYGLTILDNDRYRLNGGATMKINRGMAGVHIDGQTGSVQTLPGGDVALGQTSLAYGYSSSLDRWQRGASFQQNMQNIFEGSYAGASVDGGFELLIKTQAITDFYDEDDYYDYTWKLGLSLLDLGVSRYYYGSQGRKVGINKESLITGSQLDSLFTGVGSVREFNDSLSTIADSWAGYSGQWNSWHPARLVLNADRYLFGNWYVNAELSLNLGALAGNQRFITRAPNLLTITPRWETKRWGAYMPVQVTHQGKFLVGGAVKAGPLFAGFHNLANLVSKNKMAHGGGYLALVVKPWAQQEAKTDRRLQCAPRP